jgi:hypothetical protein
MCIRELEVNGNESSLYVCGDDARFTLRLLYLVGK